MASRLLDAALVRDLVREQFPHWADADVRPVPVQGWDNRTFRLGDDLVVRLPTAEGYVAAVEKEHLYLPVLAPVLPVAVPQPVALGRPGCGYLYPWSVRRWLPGDTAQADRIDDLSEFARDLAHFVLALRAADASDGPPAGAHSAGRGGDLRRYDAETRTVARSVARLDASIGAGPTAMLDERAVLRVWDAALAAPFVGPDVWLHGDVTASNLLVDGGRLSAVIDFGTCAVGDPACDLTIAWTLFDGSSRATFLDAVGAGAAERARARGWALWKALLTVADGPDGADAERRYGWRFDSRTIINTVLAESNEDLTDGRSVL